MEEKMEIRNLTAFVRVAELQSFSRAAEQLGYSQSAVTVQIRQLEQELGTLLFERIGRHVRLTEEGEAFLERAVAVLRAVQEAENAGKGRRKGGGKLRIGTAESLLISVLPPVFVEFGRRCPGALLSTRTAPVEKLFEMVRQNEIDLLYFLDRKTDFPEWIKVSEHRERAIFVASASHPLAGEKHISVERLQKEPLVLTERGISYRYALEQALAQEDVGSSCNQPLFAELFLGWMLGDRNIYEVVLGQYENFALSQHQCGTQAVIYSEAAEDYTLWPGLAGTLVSEDRSSEEDLLAVLTDPDGRTIGSATVKNGDSFRFDRLEEGGGPCTLTVSAVSDGEVLGTFENISIEEHRRMELGELKLEQQTSDIAAIGDSRVVKISMGYAHSAAITENGDLYLWGENRFGCLGTGDSEDRELPVKIMSGVKDVSLGLYFSGAVTESGDLYMWGYNDVGQLGTEEISTKEYSPAPVKIMEHVKDVELGASKAAAITEDGELYVWGSSSCGYTVDGEAEGSRTPVKIMDNVKMVSLGKNTEFGAALTEDGSLYTWGKWSGNGSIMPKYPAEKIMDHVKTVCMGYDTAAAVTESGELYIWGESWHGALGNGDTQHTYTTSPVKIMDQVKEVSLGNDHGAALTEDGTLYTWGNNGAGNLGNGVTGTCATPVEAMENVAQISLGGGHFAAITEDGELYTWGQSNKDQLGREGGTGQNKVVLGE